jgi:hypothetical protein
MHIIAFIEKQAVIKKILKHLGLWELTPPLSAGKTQAPIR